MRRVYVDKNGKKALESLNPWVGARMIASVDPGAQSGDLMLVCEIKRDVPLAWGFYSASPDAIGLRVAGFGAPPADVDAQTLIAERLRRAGALRALLHLPSAETNAFRLVHAEADGLGGLVVDRFCDVAVVQPNTPALERHLDVIVRTLAALGCHAVIVNRRDAMRKREQLEISDAAAVLGTAPDPMRIRENGLDFEISVLSGQKTGHYCDQRDNRRRFGDLATAFAGARPVPPRVLDVFCYTGGFSLNALRACPTANVTAVDESKTALESFKRNVELNTLPLPALIKGDAMGALIDLRRQGLRYDLINLDPPKLIGMKREAGAGINQYETLNEIALTLLAPGGVLMTHSCSGRLSREEFGEVAARSAFRAGRRVRLIGEGGQAPDHPVLLTLPTSRYLKTLVLEAE